MQILLLFIHERTFEQLSGQLFTAFLWQRSDIEVHRSDSGISLTTQGFRAPPIDTEITILTIGLSSSTQFRPIMDNQPVNSQARVLINLCCQRPF
jgi:hypothetical protein